MSTNKVKKIGFFSALSICFTSIVGIGIFLKNASVGKNVEGNGISWLVTWIICGMLAILLAYHFGKISQVESNLGITGLTSWTNEIADKKNRWFHKIVSINYGLFYNPILSLCLTFFCVEFLIEFFKTINPSISLDIWIYVLISLGFIIFFISINYFSIKFSGLISITTSVLKFIPLLMVILIGMIFYNNHNLIVDGASSTNGFNQSIRFDKAVQGIMLSIPSVLFAFDSFIGIGVFSKHIKGGEKAVSRIIVIAMILVTIVYCLICISSIFHYIPNGEGSSILNVMVDSLPINLKKGITIFVSLFIFISGFGTANSITATTINEFRNIINNKSFVLSNFFKRKYNEWKGTLFLSLMVFTFWFIIIFGTTMIVNSDAIVDGFSNIVVVFIFLVYGYLIFLFWKNKTRKQHNIIQTKNLKFYSVLVWITFILTLGFSILNIFYVFLNGIKEWNSTSNWGLFLTSNKYRNLRNIDVLIFYLSLFAFIGIFSITNFSILKRSNLSKIQ